MIAADDVKDVSHKKQLFIMQRSFPFLCELLTHNIKIQQEAIVSFIASFYCILTKNIISKVYWYKNEKTERNYDDLF